MKIRMSNYVSIGLLMTANCIASQSFAEQPTGKSNALSEYPIAVLPFQERGKEVQGMGSQASDILFAELSADPALILVERQELGKILSEAQLNVSGIVDPKKAIEIGQLTGAKLIVTGSVFQVDRTVYVVAKIIGTETSRVLGASAKGSVGDGVGALATKLGTDVIAVIKTKSDSLMAPRVAKTDRVAGLKTKLGDSPRPSVLISIAERHIGQPTFDPAAQTELTIFCRDSGFTVIDSKQGAAQQADVLIQGEGTSEFAVRHGNLISVKARLEAKAIDRATGKVIAVDRQTNVAVDLSEQMAAKEALQRAAADIAERLLPKLVNRGKAEN
jgi:TolB-like protein